MTTAPDPDDPLALRDLQEGRPSDDPLPATFAETFAESAESLYENAPCGYMTTLPDGRIVKINTTLLGWLGYPREDLVGRRYFSDLLSVGGRIYHETHFAPLLLLHGEIGGIALELKTVSGSRLPVLVTSNLERDSSGRPVLVRTTLFDARERRAYEVELLRARREADKERERLQRITAVLQTTLLPPALPEVPGLDVAAHYHIASPDEVGGDFYDLFPLGADSWSLYLGDVCGKGARAAVATSMVRYTLRAAAVHDPDPVTVLTTLNTTFLQERRLGSRDGETRAPFCTIVFGMIAPMAQTGSFVVSLATGGHPPALLMRADGTANYLPTAGGHPVGLLDDPRFVTAQVRLDPGDTLLFYTDGLTEARVPGTVRDRFGEESLLASLRGCAPATAGHAVAVVRDLLGELGSGVQDDVAAMAIHAPCPKSAAT